MTQFVVTHTPDGKVKKELTYKNNVFAYTMIPNESGKTGDDKAFEFQVSDKYPDTPEDVLEALSELDFADEDEICEHLQVLAQYEDQ